MFSSTWTPPYNFRKRRKDGYIFAPVFPNEGNLNHRMIKQSIDFHGKSLLEKIPDSLINHHSEHSEVSNLGYEDLSFKEFQKRTSAISKYEEANNELLDFITEKAPWIFKTNLVKDFTKYAWRNFMWKCYITLDRYKCLPPLEYFLKVGPDVCEEEFYKSVTVGDILFGKVIDYCGDDTHILQITATGGYHHRNLLGTNIKAELKLTDTFFLDKTIHPDQNIVLSDDNAPGRKMWKINTLITVEVLQTPNIIDGRINTEEAIRVGTKSLALKQIHYLGNQKSPPHKFVLGPCDTENISNEYPSILKSMEDKEVDSYDEELMKLKINVNTKCKSIVAMGRCLDLHHRLNHSLMNSTRDSYLSYDESVNIRKSQIDKWMKEVAENKSLLDNADIIDVMMEAFNEEPLNVHMIMNRAILNKYLSRFKNALLDIKLLSKVEPTKNFWKAEPTKFEIFKIILEYARERESTFNFRESEKLYKKCLEMYPENLEVKDIIERLKKMDSPDGKDQEVEELENILELKESLRKSVEELSLLTLDCSPEKLLEKLLETGLVKHTENEAAEQYHCKICNILIFNTSIYTHIGSNRHKKQMKQLGPRPYENTESLRDDIKEGLKTGLFKVNFNPKKGKMEHYDCTLCEVTVTSLGILGGLAGHIDSEKHQLRLTGNEETEGLLKEAMILGVVKTDPKNNFKYHCVPCDIVLSKINAASHLIGQKHRKKVEKVSKEEGPLQEAIDLGDILVTSKPDAETEYHCVHCNCDLTSKHVALSHLHGKKHHNMKNKLERRPMSPDTVRDIVKPSRVIHLIITKYPDDETIITNKRVINMASPYGEVTGVKILETKGDAEEKFSLCRKALLEMVDRPAAINFMNSFAQNQKHFQEVRVEYSKHPFLGNADTVKDLNEPSRVIHLSNLPDDEAMFNNTSLIEMASPYGEVTGVKIVNGDNRRVKLHPRQGINFKRYALLEMVDKAAAINLVNNIIRDQKNFQKISLKYSEHSYLKSCYKGFPYRPESQKKFTGAIDKSLSRERHPPASLSNFSGANDTPIGNEIHRPVSQRNFSGANNEPLRHENHCPVSQRNFFEASNQPFGHERHRPASKKNFSGANDTPIGNEIHHPISQRNFSEISNQPFGHERHHPVSKRNFSGANDTPIDNEIHRPASKRQYTGANYEQLGHEIHRPVMQGNYTGPNKEPHGHEIQSDYRPATVIDYGHQQSAKDNLGAHNVLPSSYVQRRSQPIQPEKIRPTFSSDITESLYHSSGTAADLNNVMSSMSAEQRKIWEQRLGERVKSIEQDIEDAFAEPSVQSTNSEWGESRKRKYLNEEQERTHLVDFASEKTSVYSDKRQKQLYEDEPDDEKSIDKSKYNLYARGLSIDRTKQEVYKFFSDYGDIIDVHLEWCINPTFVGEQSAYIAFKKTEDVNAMLNQHSDFYVKDSLISIEMYIDSSSFQGSVIHVSGIKEVYSNTKIELTKYFNNIGGPVKSLMLNTPDSSHSHYAFVVFHSEEVAKKIISTNKTCMFYDNILSLKKVKPLIDVKIIDESEITQKMMSVPTNKYAQLLKHSGTILKDIMNETGATYEFILHECSSFKKTLMIHGTLEQIFLASKIIKEKSGLQENSKFIEHETENDLPKILIIADHVNEVLESMCSTFVDLELDTCVQILQKVTLPRLFNEVAKILNEMSNVKYVIFVWGIQDLTENVKTSQGLFHVPKGDLAVMNEFLKQSQEVSNRLLIQFPDMKVLWTTPTPYSFEKYNMKPLKNHYEKFNLRNSTRYSREMDSQNESERSQLLPKEYWKMIQSNFNKCLIHLRNKMLQSDPHGTVDFLKLFLVSTGEQMFLEGDLSKEEWFSWGQTRLNAKGARALRHCIRKTVQRQILWGSDSEGSSEWSHHLRAMLDKEMQTREKCNRDLTIIPVAYIEEVIKK